MSITSKPDQYAEAPDAPALAAAKMLSGIIAACQKTGEHSSHAAVDLRAVEDIQRKLEANPNDLPGWLRLIRAYAVLGDKEKAAAALAKARSVFANEAQAQAQLGQAAQENALN